MGSEGFRLPDFVKKCCKIGQILCNIVNFMYFCNQKKSLSWVEVDKIQILRARHRQFGFTAASRTGSSAWLDIEGSHS